MLKILLGGSPCTFWSVANKKNRESKPEGQGWELFENYLIAKDKFDPDLFLYENNMSASKEIKQEIKKYLNVNDVFHDELVRYIEIDSNLVSAQNRKRFYIHNCGDVPLPEDRHILLTDILIDGISSQRNTDKSRTITAGYSICSQRDLRQDIQTNGYYGKQGVFELTSYTLDDYEDTAISSADGKRYLTYLVKDSKICIEDQLYETHLPDGVYIIRRLTVPECCRLQTLPDNYCDCVSNTQGYKAVGNGWTADIIIHILQEGLKEINSNEDIIVLSMYDGIATGLYCLKKLGYDNITYLAYEKDPYAIRIAKQNHPEIIELGDAYQVRQDNWSDIITKYIS